MADNASTLSTQVDDRELEIRDEMLTCRHFNGLGGFLPMGEDGIAKWDYAKTCEAGVCYRTLVGGDDSGWVTALPCLAGRFARPSNARDVVPCGLRSLPSREEAKTEVDRRRADLADIVARLDAGEDVPGVIVCGRRTEPPDKQCPQSEDGKCSSCGLADLEGIYGLGSGYGGIGTYNVCNGCGEVCDFSEDTGE